MAGVNGLKGDEPLRAPMAWTPDIAQGAGFTTGKPYRPVAPNAARQNAATEGGKKDSILSFYKTLLRVRNDHPSIARGSYDKPFVQGSVMGYQRHWEQETTLVLTNYGKRSTFVHVKDLPNDATLQPVFPATQSSHRAGKTGAARIRMAPQSTLVLLVKN